MDLVDRPVFLSTFTGAGGLDLGLEAAGFGVLGCIEKNAEARASLKANRDWPLLDPPDIIDLASDFPLEDLKNGESELDLVAGGPPCQSFSKAAQWSKNGRSGIKGCNTALDGFLALIHQLLPRAVLIENVPGFVQGETDARPYLKKFFTALNEKKGTSFNLDSRIVNAADYGIPQRRKRAILVALRDGSEFDWPDRTHEERPVRAWDALANVEPSDPPKATGKWAGLIPTVPEGENYIWHTSRGGGRNLFGYRTRFWSFLLKLAKNETSWTIPAQPGPATGPFHWDNRPLSVEEMLRLQTFPSDWKIHGGYRHKVRQIGNATPPLLAEVFGRQLLTHLEGHEFNTQPTFEIERQENIPPPEPTQPVPEEYLRFEGDHDPHPGPGKGPNPIMEAESDA